MENVYLLYYILHILITKDILEKFCVVVCFYIVSNKTLN